MSAQPKHHEEAESPDTLREIARALQGLRFGAVEITVHNSQIVQIERKEKIRLQAASSRQA